jgi:tetraacyldisaccharide 4'-kinase
MKRISFIQTALLPLTLPLSAVYALAVYVRNRLFDAGVLKSFTFDIPLISVGNITVGGTGKTPHIEHLINMFPDRRIAVLSRGYGRRSKGFRYVNPDDDAADTGDEPLQIKRKYPNTVVAVDVRRERAIARLMHDCPDLQAILLDDAFQYRRITPALNIVLVDFNNPAYSDLPLPAGRLRDLCSSLRRAGTIIVSKCPENITADVKSTVTARLRRNATCDIFFSTLEYGAPAPVFHDKVLSVNDKDLNVNDKDLNVNPEVLSINDKDLNINADNRLFIFAGVARPELFFDAAASRIAHSAKTVKAYPDHYAYTAADARNFAAVADTGAILITTEKDAVKLRAFAGLFSADAKRRTLYLPVKVAIADNARQFAGKIVGIMNYEL